MFTLFLLPNFWKIFAWGPVFHLFNPLTPCIYTSRWNLQNIFVSISNHFLMMLVFAFITNTLYINLYPVKNRRNDNNLRWKMFYVVVLSCFHSHFPPLRSFVISMLELSFHRYTKVENPGRRVRLQMFLHKFWVVGSKIL